MKVSDFEDIVKSTAKYKETVPELLLEGDARLLYTTLGLAGEVGEFTEKIKKALRRGETPTELCHNLELAKELGDALWYLTMTANELGFTLEEIMTLNNEKLLDRRNRNRIIGEGDNR